MNKRINIEDPGGVWWKYGNFFIKKEGTISFLKEQIPALVEALKKMSLMRNVLLT